LGKGSGEEKEQERTSISLRQMIQEKAAWEGKKDGGQKYRWEKSLVNPSPPNNTAD